MEIILWTFGTYVLLLDLITSYRLYKDELYEPWQKAVQFVIIWMLPLLGAFFIAVLLNRTVDATVKLPKYFRWIGGLFLLSNNHTMQGYPSSMNDYGDHNGAGGDFGCHGGDGGGCGGE